MTLRVALLPCLLLGACSDKTDDSGGAVAGEDIILTDANNFSYAGAIDVPSIVTVSAQNVEVCWDAVDTDLQCHEMDPLTDIENVGLVRFPNLTQADVEDGLAHNNLLQADISGYVEYRPDGKTACANLEDFSFFGTAIDVAAEFTEGGGTYMLLLTQGTLPGVGARMLTFLEPQASSTASSVDVEPGCGMLDFEADIHSATPIPALKDGPWMVDWSGLTVDGQGSEIELGNVDSLMLAFYEGSTASDLEGHFLDLELLATTIYTQDLEGSNTFDLSTLEGFTGFSGDGTWLFALRCSRCYNPAPVFLGALDPQ
jgi:hypothetical protein